MIAPNKHLSNQIKYDLLTNRPTHAVQDTSQISQIIFQ
jgi:hypothetical protein